MFCKQLAGLQPVPQALFFTPLVPVDLWALPTCPELSAYLLKHFCFSSPGFVLHSTYSLINPSAEFNSLLLMGSLLPHGSTQLLTIFMYIWLPPLPNLKGMGREVCIDYTQLTLDLVDLSKSHYCSRHLGLSRHHPASVKWDQWQFTSRGWL